MFRRPLLADLAVAAAVATVTCVAIAVTRQPGNEDYVRPPDLAAYLLGVTIGALLLGRRRWPAGVLVADSAVLMLYYGLEYPGITPAIPLAAALLNATLAGRTRWALGVAGYWWLLGIYFRTAHLHEPVLEMAYGMTEQAALFAVTILFGQAWRTRRERAELAATNERLRIARETHDVLAHTITAIGVQAGLAADVMDTQPQQAKRRWPPSARRPVRPWPSYGRRWAPCAIR